MTKMNIILKLLVILEMSRVILNKQQIGSTY